MFNLLKRSPPIKKTSRPIGPPVFDIATIECVEIEPLLAELHNKVVNSDAVRSCIAAGMTIATAEAIRELAGLLPAIEAGLSQATEALQSASGGADQAAREMVKNWKSKRSRARLLIIELRESIGIK